MNIVKVESAWDAKVAARRHNERTIIEPIVDKLLVEVTKASSGGNLQLAVTGPTLGNLSADHMSDVLARMRNRGFAVKIGDGEGVLIDWTEAKEPRGSFQGRD